MAWSASIVQKGIIDKSFIVGVSYSNGALQFVEQLNLTGATLQGLSDIVSSRLAQLEITQALIPQVTVGSFTPTTITPPSLTPLQVFITNLRALRNAQELVNLGVMTITDTAYITARTNVQNTFDPSFIGSF